MHTKRNKGFTLIELVVAVGIFSVMLVVISGAFTYFVSNERRQIGEQSLQEDLRVALELFNKEARTGYGDTYKANTDKSAITFRNQNGACVQYAKTSDGKLTRAEVNASQDGICSEQDYVVASSLTDPFTEITKLKFLPIPAETDETTGALTSQGYITIVLQARASGNQETEVKMQSSITSRQYMAYLTPAT